MTICMNRECPGLSCKGDKGEGCWIAIMIHDTIKLDNDVPLPKSYRLHGGRLGGRTYDGVCVDLLRDTQSVEDGYYVFNGLEYFWTVREKRDNAVTVNLGVDKKTV